jgi:hypothetical protein
MKRDSLNGLFAIVVGILFVFMAGRMSAQSVTAEEAAKVCQRFLTEKTSPEAAAALSATLQESVADADGMVYLYRFALAPHGFVLVSASKSVMPVLAYSLEDDYEAIPPVKSAFSGYALETRRVETAKVGALPRDAADWERYLADEFVPKVPKTPVRGPLLTTRWNQNKFYNTYCPWDADSGPYYDFRVPNGCTALATAQIMNYHRHPKQGQGASMYAAQGYGMQSVNFAHQTYNWDAMCNEPLSYANEISKIAYHVGVSIKMGYNPTGSGAFTEDAAKRLYENFFYDQSITKYVRDSYPGEHVSEYIAVLKEEIDRHRPILYSGHAPDGTNGHAFVLDDYDDNDRFHINWGWGGSSNAYFAMDNFTVGGSSFNSSCKAITNIFPSSAITPSTCVQRQRNTASFGYVSDGSQTARPYQPNPDCSWIVAAPGANSYTFSFDRLDLKPNVDYVTIYNGPEVSSGVKVSLTGNQVPTATYTVNADSVLITFTTTGNEPTNTDYYGFLISYQSQLRDYTPCDLMTNVTDWHTILSDGTASGKDYSPETNCTWNVSLNFISGYAFTLPKFNLGSGDFVDVYDNTTNPPTLYKRFDLNNMPNGVYNVPFSKMRVNFVADNWDQGDGFNFEYYAIAGVDDEHGVRDAQVYPNPAADYFNISFSLDESTQVDVKLMDAAGKVVSSKSLPSSVGYNQHRMDVSGLTSGFYFMEIATPKGRLIRKVMVQ